MGLQPTMSRTDLLLNCQYPFADGVETHDEPGEPARYGSAFHELLGEGLLYYFHDAGLQPNWTDARFETLRLKWRLAPSVVSSMRDHVSASTKTLIAWLEGANPWGEDFIRRDENSNGPIVEKAFIVRPSVNLAQTQVRQINLPSEDAHHYEGLKRGEIAGTVDLLVGPLILDHKTGHKDFSSPSALGQLKSAALIRGSKYLAVLDADRRGIPTVYAEEIEVSDLEEHSKKLRTALRRINDGSMRPGPWCATCPALDNCPTKNNDLLARSAALVTRASDELHPEETADLATAVNVARLHQLINQFERLAKPAKEAIRMWMKEHPEEMPVRPDGKVLQFVEKGFTNLSMASIIRAYGKLEGERVIAKLRKDGAIETGKREELHALADR
jgi:hypothetical protein